MKIVRRFLGVLFLPLLPVVCVLDIAGWYAQTGVRVSLSRSVADVWDVWLEEFWNEG